MLHSGVFIGLDLRLKENMATNSHQTLGTAGLKHLSEEEALLRDSVRRFAREAITPLVREMDEHQKMDAPLVRQLFALGLMGIEIPEAYGGSSGTFFESILACL